ncbi:MAG: cysteine desulfurase family protein [Gemmatimonadaceae bacterium]
MTTPPIYLDHAATTPVRQEVLDAMMPYFATKFGNASSTHRWGREARAAIDTARERIAACLGASPDEICLTSGGTEADNLCILGGWRVQRGNGRNGVVTSPIEHKAVLASMHQAAREGADERVLGVGSNGVVDLDSARALMRDDVAIASVMWVNNETGVIQPIVELATLAKERGAIFHTDAVQAFGKVDIDTKAVPVDFLSISGHKFGAPKAIGAAYVRRGTALAPLFFGGTQDRGRRPGTENVPMAIALATAMELTLAERDAEVARLRALRDRLEDALLATVPDAVVHGRGAPRAPHILNLSVPGTDSESMLMALDLQGIAASSGSACQSGSVTPSHVLDAMGVPAALGSAAIRLSLGKLTTAAHIDRVLEIFPSLIAKSRGLAGKF